MKSSPLKTIAGALLLACALLAHAEVRLGDPLPLSSDVTVGKLANGLTYYIQKNGKPEKKVELRLVVKAGSILEDEDQQGLAHFTEHMAFNGSTHFKRNELISYLQSIGVKFGADLNAYTSFDETVYVLPIPTDKKENLERGFLVLEDWAHGLSFNDADIDSERAIILEEARLGKGAGDRMNKVLLPKLLNGSRYAERMPIGKEDIIQHFHYDAIRRFYRDWYRPDLMAVVVVGDIEPAAAEKMIQAHFGKLTNPVNERPRLYAKVPVRDQTEALVITDKEADSNSVFIRYPIREAREPVTIADYRQKMIENLYGGMLGARMQELTQQANPPFIQGGGGIGKLVRGYESFSAYAMIGKAGVVPAINALVQEDERARRFGFSQAELDRARANMLRNYERMYKERDKSDSSAYVAEFMRNFLERESIPGIANEYSYARELLPQVSLAEVNQVAATQIPAGQKKLVVYMGTEHGANSDGVPGSASLLAAVDAAERLPLVARQEKVLSKQLMDAPPPAGAIASEKTIAELGVTELTLSNGVKVMLKPTDFQNDQVLMSATRFGGQSLFPDADVFNARYAASIAGQMGLKTFSPFDLQKMLAGKTVYLGASLGNLSESLRGGSSSADIETMLQLVYLNFTAPRKDSAVYQSFISRQQDMARNNMAQPEAVFADTVQSALFNDNPRVAKVARPEDFDKVGLDRTLEIYRQRFSSAKDMTFFIVGSFDLARIKPLIATYLASLPAGNIRTTYQDLGVRPVEGVVKKQVFAGAEAKSDVSITFTGNAAYGEDANMKLMALTEVMNIRLIEELREKRGLIYGGGLRADLSKFPYGHYTISANLPTGPEKVDQVIASTFDVIRQMQADGPLASDLDKVKENWIKNQGKSLRENSYWLNRLQGAVQQGTDPRSILDYAQRVNAISTDDLRQAARHYFNLDNYVQVVLYPEKKIMALAKAK
ncbi:M16 family metallopeptidase [Janthinobacterium agaricidamnosum]|uniref:Insulinase family protein n=1 Tax=Janthinobacterium agaricidamnosum NBRC 102515 = DSM 9628 TaxID=1349767 RepID=W0V8C3_9BURK|nr:M16 family metallopeptidase [Janthinobacterium agaricidamnosum]CDG83860.1 insulinase family protein [Janthinobacterium agaricidamnosum NBRC 102515 = DSM 9628]